MAKWKDPDSWQARSNKRRDFRHTHDGPETSRHRGKRKNTKKWCKGKVGVKHDFKPTPWRVPGGYSDMFIVDRCDNCGREINVRPVSRYWPWTKKGNRG